MNRTQGRYDPCPEVGAGDEQISVLRETAIDFFSVECSDEDNGLALDDQSQAVISRPDAGIGSLSPEPLEVPD